MSQKKEETVSILRVNKKEYRFNENDRDFVREMLATEFGFANAQVIETYEHQGEGVVQVVVIDMKANMNDDEIFEAVENALPHQHGFVAVYYESVYNNIVKERNKPINNVYQMVNYSRR